MKGNNFNENTRVQVPAALHLCRLGYTYLDDIPEYDKRTNIITPIFKQSIKKLNPTMTDLDVSQLLEKIVSEAKNDNLGREFYEMLSSNSGIKLIDFDDPYQNSWHITTEFTCEDEESGDNFRPDITCFINGLPLAFIEVKKPNNREGNTLLEPAHKEANGTVKKFDYVVSNPPFKLDFPEYRDTLAADGKRFWAGVPNAVKQIKPKPTMAIYTCFIQHVLNSLSSRGKGAIVVPTGFITAKSGIENKILHSIVDEKWVYGVISMPSNVFADTGTNVSVVFFDKSAMSDKVILVDASKLGEDYQDANNNKKHRLLDKEVELIVNTFRNKEAVDGLSVAVTYDEIREKGYSLSAGQYFDIKIEYVDITEEEFNRRMADYESKLTEMFAESYRLESEILAQLKSLKFNS